MQKAFKWLETNAVSYEFHNYKEKGIDRATLEKWLQKFPANLLVNTRSTTFRALTATEKEGINDNAAAIELMLTYNSIIKRPVWELNDQPVLLGWDATAVSQLVLGHP